MAMMTLRVGSFPHQMYVARCDCVDGKEVKSRNHLGQHVGTPSCSSCGRAYRLDERLAQQPFTQLTPERKA